MVHDGLVIVASDDANLIYAFDAATGRPVWKTEPIPDEVRLARSLGVAKGRLIATGDRVLLFDVKTGKLLHSWPDSGHGLRGTGRGVAPVTNLLAHATWNPRAPTRTRSGPTRRSGFKRRIGKRAAISRSAMAT